MTPRIIGHYPDGRPVHAMAGGDDTTLDNGGLTDIAIATDTSGGKEIQLVKLTVSADGDRTHAPLDASDGLKVNLGADNDVTVSGTVTATLAAGTASIGKLAANSGVDIGDVDIASIAAGTAYIGRLRMTDGTTDSDVIDLGTYAGPGVYLLDGGGDPAVASPQAVINSGTITGNQTAYTALDAYHSGYLTFAALVSGNGKTGHILGATAYDTNDIGASLRLWLFRDTVTGTTLNTQLSVSATDIVKCIGWIDFSTWADGLGTQVSTGSLSTSGPLPFACAGTVDDLYGIVQCISAPTFTADTPLTIDLMVQPD